MSEAMDERSPAKLPALLTRRAFARVLAAAAAAIAISPGKIVLASAISSAGTHAIVSFHMDQPYLDRTGTAVPYYPPAGARSAQSAGLLPEELFRRNFIYA